MCENQVVPRSYSWCFSRSTLDSTAQGISFYSSPEKLPEGFGSLLTAGRETTTAWSEKLHSLASFCILQTCEGMNAARILRDHKHPLQFNSAALQLQHTKACTPRAAFRGSQRNRIQPNPLEMKWRRFERFGRPGRCTLTALRRGWLLPRSRRNFDSGSRCLAWQQLCRFAALPRNAKYWNSKNAFP
jgi:hypothetical protein